MAQSDSAAEPQGHRQLAGRRRLAHDDASLGFGRIVGSVVEAPNVLTNMV